MAACVHDYFRVADDSPTTSSFTPQFPGQGPFLRAPQGVKWNASRWSGWLDNPSICGPTENSVHRANCPKNGGSDDKTPLRCRDLFMRHSADWWLAGENTNHKLGKGRTGGVRLSVESPRFRSA